MIKNIFLIGNPNVGKSVIFSRLTGVHVIASNYPGTTVELSKGYLKIGEDRLEVIDLPGTYSLNPSSNAEEVAVSILRESDVSQCAVLNILDATNLERNLFLTLELIEAGYSVIVSLNMCDDTAHRGISIDVEKLEKYLGVPVVATCAVTGTGIKFLIERIKDALPKTGVRRTNEERWLEIGRIITEVQKLSHRHHTLREVLEDASIRPLSGLVIAGVVVYAAFKIVRFVGEGLINNITDPVFFRWYQPLLEKISKALGGDGFWHHLIIGDLIQGKIDFKQSLGVMTTAPYIEFSMVLPYVLAFYFVLSVLEDIGYLPRLSILLDNVLHRLGLHGYAIIPVLLGFGCNVPGILATRSLDSKRERFIASTLISIGVPCVPLQAMIFALLGKFSGLYVGGVYLVLFAVVLILGVILNKLLHGYSQEFMLEIPPYRFPPLALLGKKLYFRVKGFIFEALPVVLVGVLAINLLIYSHLFEKVSALFSPVVKGLFGLPKETAISLIIGFFRKDVAAGMLMPLGLSAKQLFIATTLLAMSFPCVATFVIIGKELGIKYLIKSTLLMIAASMVVGALLNLGIRP